MKKEFVPYDIALAMKELGFNEICMRMYKKGVKHLISTMDMPNAIYSADVKIQAPLYQQAFRWFREKYSIVGYVHPFNGNYTYSIISNLVEYNNNKKTYEEAQDACLKKLIEIVRNEK
jgi:hypothetical protein